MLQNLCKKKKKNKKSTWKNINNILNRNSNKTADTKYFLINNDSISDTKIIANEFNKYFVDIGNDLSQSLTDPENKSYTDYLKSQLQYDFNFELVSEDTVKKVIGMLKNKSTRGIDGLSNKLVKRLHLEIASSLTLIINQCFTGIFPDKLKLAKVIPIHKKEDNSLLQNYRPISILPSLSKVIETIMHDQVNSFFCCNNLFYNSQYGFRKSHSTELASLEMIDRVAMQLDRNEIPINIYLDISKAFDTLNHDILLEKLNYYGIRGNSLKLFRSYLKNRKQCVQYKNSVSDFLPIKTGVPQGSVLVPLLYIIYTNDIAHACSKFYPIIYADDTTLSATINTFSSSENKKSIDQNINTELQNILDWLRLNKLSLNIKKTKAMLFYTPQRASTIKFPKINMADTNIEFVYKYNFLGIIVDSNLTWKEHLKFVYSKIVKVSAILNKLKHYLPYGILVTIYKSIIEPHFNYGILVWGSHIHKLSRLQKRVIRIVENTGYNYHTSPIFKRLNLIKCSDLCALHDLKFCHKLKNNKLPIYFSSMFAKHSDYHHYQTRNSENFQLPLLAHAFAKNSIRSRVPLIYNMSPNIIRDKIFTHSFSSFAKYVQIYILSNYCSECSIPNCYICLQAQNHEN